MTDTKPSDEPTIVEEQKKPVVRRTTFKFKIEPLVPYFPECPKASLDKLQEIRGLYNLMKIKEADAQVESLKLDPATNDSKEQLTLMRVQFWQAKSHYLVGDYKKSLELANERVTELTKKYSALISNTKQNPENFSSLEKALNNITDDAEEEESGATVTEIKDEDAI